MNGGLRAFRGICANGRRRGRCGRGLGGSGGPCGLRGGGPWGRRFASPFPSSSVECWSYILRGRARVCMPLRPRLSMRQAASVPDAAGDIPSDESLSAGTGSRLGGPGGPRTWAAETRRRSLTLAVEHREARGSRAPVGPDSAPCGGRAYVAPSSASWRPMRRHAARSSGTETGVVRWPG